MRTTLLDHVIPRYARCSGRGHGCYTATFSRLAILVETGFQRTPAATLPGGFYSFEPNSHTSGRWNVGGSDLLGFRFTS
jgi:hypothetical protein